jgi:hypothetical protein
MHTIESNLGTIDISEDRREGYRKQLEKLQNAKLLGPSHRAFFSLDKIDEYIAVNCDILFLGVERFIESRGYKTPENKRMLKAHGDSEDGTWKYFEKQGDQEIFTPVNDWIRNYDGFHDLLVISSCNAGKVKVKARNSFVVYVNGISNDSIILELLLDRKHEFVISEPEDLARTK